MEWHKRDQGYYCYKCGSVAKHYISEKLGQECAPPSPKSRAQYVVRARRKHANEQPTNSTTTPASSSCARTATAPSTD
eukprot:8740491-Pyramimonas_sp.AAC.1